MIFGEGFLFCTWKYCKDLYISLREGITFVGRSSKSKPKFEFQACIWIVHCIIIFWITLLTWAIIGFYLTILTGATCICHPDNEELKRVDLIFLSGRWCRTTSGIPHASIIRISLNKDASWMPRSIANCYTFAIVHLLFMPAQFASRQCTNAYWPPNSNQIARNIMRLW